MFETLRPDPTFYPSARLAMQAPPERLGYTALLSPDASRPDALAVVDLDPTSKTYGTVLYRLDMPNRGDEFHHFGWNACSSALSPMSGHAFLQRRYLIIPGIRSSRIYVVDTRPDPARPTIVKIIEPDEVLRKTGYSRPHTIHCGPEGIYISTLGGGGADGTQGPPGVFIMDCESFEIRGQWEIDRGPQKLHYDFWWNLPRDYMVSSEWGLPPQFENGIVAEDLLANKYGHSIHFWDLRGRKHLQTIDLGANHQMALEIRPAHDPTREYGFLRRRRHDQPRRLDLDLVPRGRPVPCEEDRGDPARAGRCIGAAGVAEGFRRGAAADQRHRPVARRPLSVCRVLGHRRAEAIRRERPDAA